MWPSTELAPMALYAAAAVPGMATWVPAVRSTVNSCTREPSAAMLWLRYALSVHTESTLGCRTGTWVGGGSLTGPTRGGTPLALPGQKTAAAAATSSRPATPRSSRASPGRAGGVGRFVTGPLKYVVTGL